MSYELKDLIKKTSEELITLLNEEPDVAPLVEKAMEAQRVGAKILKAKKNEEEEAEAEEEKKRKMKLEEEEAEKKKKKEADEKKAQEGEDKRNKGVEVKTDAIIRLEAKEFKLDLPSEKETAEHITKSWNLLTEAVEKKDANAISSYFEEAKLPSDLTIKSLKGVAKHFKDKMNIESNLEREIAMLETKSNVAKNLSGYQRNAFALEIKNAYSSQIGTDFGGLPLSTAVTFQEKFFLESSFLGLVNIVPTIAVDTRILNIAKLPTASYVAEGQIADTQDMGHWESVTIKTTGHYQATQIMTDLLAHHNPENIMNQVVGASAVAIARTVKQDGLSGKGANDGVKGVLTETPYDITKFSLQDAKWSKPAGSLKVLTVNAGTAAAKNIDPETLIQLKREAIPNTYLNTGETAWVMNSRTFGHFEGKRTSTGAFLLDTIAYFMHGGIMSAEIRNVNFSEARPENNPIGATQLYKTGGTILQCMLGYPVVIDDAMPDIGNDTIPILFGNFKAAYTLTQNVATGIRPLLFGAQTKAPGMNNLVITGNQFFQGFQVFAKFGGRMVNSQAIAGLRTKVA